MAVVKYLLAFEVNVSFVIKITSEWFDGKSHNLWCGLINTGDDSFVTL